MADSAVGIRFTSLCRMLHEELRWMPHDLPPFMARAAFPSIVAAQAYVRLSLPLPRMGGGPVAGVRHRELMAIQAELPRMAECAVAPQHGEPSMGADEVPPLV